jgi:hypothetical protein
MRNRCGLWPNALIITDKQLEYVKNCAEIVDRLKYNGLNDVRPDMITAQMLAGVFQVQEVLVAGGLYVSTDVQDTTPTFADLWDNTEAALVVLPRNVVASDQGVPHLDIMDPCFARTVHWGADGSVFGGVYETYEDPARRGMMVRHRMDVDEIVRYSDCCQLITGVLS